MVSPSCPFLLSPEMSVRKLLAPAGHIWLQPASGSEGMSQIWTDARGLMLASGWESAGISTRWHPLSGPGRRAGGLSHPQVCASERLPVSPFSGHATLGTVAAAQVSPAY